MKYLVAVFDCAGSFAEFKAETFDKALDVYDDCKSKWPEKAVRVYRPENCDASFDGLTTEEWEAVYG